MSARPEPGTMSRPVPEAAPVVGLVLAFAFALFGLLFSSDHLATVLVSVGLLYPFVVFGIVRSESPQTVFVPDAVLAAGFLGAAPTLLYGVVAGRPLFGALAAVVVALAAVDYRRQRGGRLRRRARTVGVACCLGGGLAAFGVLAATGRPNEGLAAGAVLVAVGGLLALDAAS